MRERPFSNGQAGPGFAALNPGYGLRSGDLHFAVPSQDHAASIPRAGIADRSFPGAAGYSYDAGEPDDKAVHT